MALRAAATTTPAASRGLRALFSTFSSNFPFSPPQPQVEKPPPAEPSTNLFVSGLSKRTTSEGLREAFAKHGEVVNARVVTDRVSGYSKGFGFVRYATLEDAAAGIKGLDGQFLDGWVIFAEYARPRPPPPSIQNDNTAGGYGNYNGPSYGRNNM
ncbi:organelle RRM domain-containing protein 2, mitochondrial-like [Nicotiana tabacum]|uniref:Glycine-rich RNA-binding protein 3, mitochondrial-like n=1 Tax=Nicotiana tabacum TaxID=4097 RepID=A0A1S4D9S8_TOBAC|nr:organelle RRM domain-containing protein 2, mitochondrial [Nicotiana tomentosiformis]XP_016510167.1 PREDICTED: glycine-rich RNA-binding protein 3, mitochondrial-like [Nicotiana tabacum]